MSFVTDQKAIDYLKSFPVKDKANLKILFPGSDDLSLAFLSRMLVFNPFIRPTIQECLDDPYLNDIKEYYKPQEDLENHEPLSEEKQTEIF